MKTSLLSGSFVIGLLVCGNAAAEVAKLPPSGTTHFTTYFAMHPAHELKMVDDSSISVVELVGLPETPMVSRTSTIWWSDAWPVSGS